MGRVSFADCRVSNRNNFLLAVSLCQASLLKVGGEAEAGRGVAIQLFGGHVVAVDAGVLAGHAGGTGSLRNP